jgi:hypothetical protein
MLLVPDPAAAAAYLLLLALPRLPARLPTRPSYLSLRLLRPASSDRACTAARLRS